MLVAIAGQIIILKSLILLMDLDLEDYFNKGLNNKGSFFFCLIIPFILYIF